MLFRYQNSVQWDRGLAKKVRFHILYSHCLQHNAKPHWAIKFIGETHYKLKCHLNHSSFKLLFLCRKLVGTLNNQELRFSSSLLGMIIREKWGLLINGLNLPLLKETPKCIQGGKSDPHHGEEGKCNTDSSFSLSLMLVPFSTLTKMSNWKALIHF